MVKSVDKCAVCDGTGKIDLELTSPVYCPVCKGTGSLLKASQLESLHRAAPDLLAALKAAIEPLELYHAYGWPDRDGVIAKVKAAIRKAEGES